MSAVLRERGRIAPLASVEEALAFLERHGDSLPPGSARRAIVGDPETVRVGLEAVADDYGADEVLVVTMTHDHDARRHSYELIAGAFALGGDAAAAEPLVAS
jgi:alkanesulfonate monooxygenase SsuD/methylene tetrahydromethanopterin reductase-like flavin-dependent oxidoreductase (luciferase family)